MHKILTLFKREYRAAVRTKSFIISIILIPFLMGGSFLVMVIMEDKQDVDDKKIVVMDHTGQLANMLEEQANERNQAEVNDPESGEKIKPAYVLIKVAPDTANLLDQKLKLSDQIRAKELDAVVEIGKGIYDPSAYPDQVYMRYYSENAFGDDTRWWFSNAINNYMRKLRIEKLELAPDVTNLLFMWPNIEAMGLVNVDRKTGAQVDAKRANELQTFLVPYIMVMLMFMLTMMSAVPLLSAVMEEKTEKVAEVLLGTVTPFEFMMGKVLGGLGISLTVATLYVVSGIFIAKTTGNADLIPYDLLPWFFAYTFLYIVMVGSGMAALGATCNDNKDAQSLQFPAMFPVIIPLFIIVPLIQNPTGGLATTMSFIPPFTPTLMVIRLATPVTIPLWQPLVGLVAVILWTVFTVWIGARIFRTAILMQGQKPSLRNLVKYAVRS